jgi:Protein of unknown function (DUF3237)
VSPVRPAEPSLELLAHVRADVDAPRVVGATPLGERRVVPIAGGEVDGPLLRGRILPGGADWQLVCADGTAFLEARYSVLTHDGALVEVRNLGVRHGRPEVLARIQAGEAVDPSEYYFRSTPRFEAGDGRYAWLNRIVAVASGARLAGEVRLDVYAVR